MTNAILFICILFFVQLFRLLQIYEIQKDNSNNNSLFIQEYILRFAFENSKNI